MASSSDSSDEDIEKFAAIAGIVESEISKKCNENSQGISKPHNKPSLRHWREEEDITCSTSELITPEFKRHVAKKLSKFLDSNYICTQEGGHLHNGHQSSLRESSGIKLLLTSNQSLRAESVKEIPSLTTSKKNKRNCLSSSSESDTDEEELNRLAEAAVSGHSIIQNVANGGKVDGVCEATENGNVKRKKEKKKKREKKKRKEEDEEQQKKKHKKHKKEKEKT